MTEIYLVRHCESMANRMFSFAGRTDVDISAKGALQLECLTEYFTDIKIDAVYSSPLKRAYKTAQAVSVPKCLPITVVDDLIEINLGILDGKPVSCMTDEQTYLWNMQPHNFSVEGSETMQQVAERAYAALKIIAENENGKTVFVATHGCVIRNLMRVLHGYAPTGINEIDWCDNCGINHLYYSAGSFLIDFENRTEHLSEDAAAVPVSEWTE